MDKEYAKYLLGKTKKDYDLIAEDFSRTRDYPWPEIRFLFDDYVEVGNRILDLGCGNGRYHQFFKDKKIEYTGIDYSEKLIEIAKNKYPEAEFQVADAFNLPFPDNFFDRIFSIAVLHHIPSLELRQQFLKEAKRVLKPEGKFILTVWKFHRPKEILLIFKFSVLSFLRLSKLDVRDILEPWGKKIKRYYHCFGKKEIKNLIKEANFKINNMGVVKNERGNRRNIYLVAEK